MARVGFVLKRLARKELVIILVVMITVLAWAPWVTDDFAIASVVDRLGGEDRPFNHLGEMMPVRDVPKNVVRIPFGAIVYFPSEAMFIVTFLGVVL